MDKWNVTPDILSMTGASGRALVVKGHETVTMVDLPASPPEIDEVITLTGELAIAGFRTLILTKKPVTAPSFPLYPNLQVLWPGHFPDIPTITDESAVDLLSGIAPSLLVNDGIKEIIDDTGREFRLDPCLGAPMEIAVRILPERILIINDDIGIDTPPRVRPGSVHETIMQMAEWLSRPPSVLIPASGKPIAGEDVKLTLDRSVRYLRSLYSLTRNGLFEARYPMERLIYTIPLNAVWDTPAPSRILLDLHKTNVRDMAKEIWQRVQGEADDVTLVS